VRLADEDEVNVTVREYTVRVCKLCHRRYVYPRGSRMPGAIGPCCQWSLFEVDGRMHVHNVTPLAAGERSERRTVASGWE
jgi:hypothetical protein